MLLENLFDGPLRCVAFGVTLEQERLTVWVVIEACACHVWVSTMNGAYEAGLRL